MTGKITSAYQQFSHRIQRQQESQQPPSVRQSNSKNKSQNSVQSAPTSQRTGDQQRQLRQLRETGTLENLRTILSEDEESVLARIFPETNTSYTADAQKQSQRTKPAKGGLLDLKY
ncbi:MAG: hypothetical protein K9N46_07135 [Candidatus Marinimicrobia bacterium]|nr:hypothetical protein [Candidatus Neomarinimicrobiota bacterium]MCF7880495.1 hypothetical protein [Candidatus Neomarinimicrobiota bacterium]